MQRRTSKAPEQTQCRAVPRSSSAVARPRFNVCLCAVGPVQSSQLRRPHSYILVPGCGLRAYLSLSGSCRVYPYPARCARAVSGLPRGFHFTTHQHDHAQHHMFRTCGPGDATPWRGAGRQTSVKQNAASQHRNRQSLSHRTFLIWNFCPPLVELPASRSWCTLIGTLIGTIPRTSLRGRGFPT